MGETPSPVTELLLQWRRGDKSALDRLLPMVYSELRQIARRHLRRERVGHTLQPTALVHEAYVQLAGKDNPQWRDRIHFYAVASQLMRRVLVDHARRRNADKRGGGAIKVTLDEARDSAEEKATDLIALDDALQDLEKMDERKSKIIELRFFGGLDLDETAEVLGVSVSTVVKEAKVARAWLFEQLAK